MDERDPGGQQGSDALLAQALAEQQALFRAKFGRDPGPDDPLLFDPDADEPVALSPAKLEAGIVEALEVADIDPAFVYAFQHTGLIVTQDNIDQLSEDDLADWTAAVERFRALHGDADEADMAWLDDDDLLGLDDDPDLDDDDFLAALTDDARLFFASPDFESVRELATLLVDAIEGSGTLAASVLWTGRRRKGGLPRRLA